MINEFIENIETIKNILYKDQRINKNKIIMYKDSEKDNEASFLKNNINIGCIILSTNLAARGTNIKISYKLNQSEGLHAILTYFPVSKRAEKQASERAGRKGENGSGEVITANQNIDESKKNRDTLLYSTPTPETRRSFISKTAVNNIFFNFRAKVKFQKNPDVHTTNHRHPREKPTRHSTNDFSIRYGLHETTFNKFRNTKQIFSMTTPTATLTAMMNLLKKNKKTRKRKKQAIKEES